MKLTDSFRHFLRRIYSAERMQGLMEQLDDAQGSLGFDTMMGEPAEMQQNPVYHLVVRVPDEPTRIETLGIGEYLIGRWPPCRILLNPRNISRVHCIVTVHSDGEVTLRDLNSRNGTIVNEMVIDPASKYVLQINDTITLTATTLTLIRM